jgi:hypothetical protein
MVWRRALLMREFFDSLPNLEKFTRVMIFATKNVNECQISTVLTVLITRETRVPNFSSINSPAIKPRTRGLLVLLCFLRTLRGLTTSS